MAISIEEILAKKNLPIDLYDRAHDIRLEDPLEKHAKWASVNCYSVPFPKTAESKVATKKAPEEQPEKKEDAIARVDHGIQHVARASKIYVPVFVNLYRLFNHPQAEELTDENIKLIQIAILFHDAGREGEGKDEWDADSAIMLYCYLTRVLKVEPARAKIFAEAINSKDQELGITDFDIEICNKIKALTINSDIPEKFLKLFALKMMLEGGNLKNKKLLQYSEYLFPEGIPDIEDAELKSLEVGNNVVKEEKDQLSDELPAVKDSELSKPKVADNVVKEEKKPQESNKEEDKSKHYFVLQEDSNGKFSWIVDTQSKKNIFQKIIKDCDCLDIIRARSHFDVYRLDFFNDIAGSRPQAYELLIRLVREVRSFIYRQGDTLGLKQMDIKKQFEHPDVCAAILASLNKYSAAYPILSKFSAVLDRNELLKSLPPKKLGKMRQLIETQTVLARGEGVPSRRVEKKNKPTLSGAGFDIYMASRRMGVPTRSGRLNKNGHPHRSTSLIGNGGGVFASAGFLIENPPIESITYVSSDDFSSGFGTKNIDKKEYKLMSPDEVKSGLENLKTRLQETSNNSATHSHNEVLCNVTDFNKIYFSLDPNFINSKVGKSPDPTHPYSPLLQAFFIQQEHLKATSIKLPIYEYSSVRDEISEDPVELSESEIKEMWLEMCKSYMEKHLFESLVQSSKTIKVLAMYGATQYHWDDIAPADTCFSESFQQDLDRMIFQAREKIFFSQLRDNPQLFLTEKHFKFFIKHPESLLKVKDILALFIRNVIATRTMFADVVSLDDFDVRLNSECHFQDITSVCSSDCKKIEIESWFVSYNSSIKINVYAKLLNLDDEVRAIQSEARTLVASDMAARKSVSVETINNTRPEVDGLTKFIYVFNLCDSFKPEFQAIVINYMTKLPLLVWHSFNTLYEIEPQSSAAQFCEYLSQLKNMSALTPQIMLAAKQIITELLKQFALATKSEEYIYCSQNLTRCFETAQLVGISRQELKDVFLSWQAGAKKKFRHTILDALNNTGLLSDYDVFKCVLNNIKDDEKFPKSKLPDSCVKLFQQETATRFNEVIASVKDESLQDQFNKVCEFIIDYMNKRYPVVLPTEVKEHYLWMLDIPDFNSAEHVKTINEYLANNESGLSYSRFKLFYPTFSSNQQEAKDATLSVTVPTLTMTQTPS
ncbi:MAG: SidE phosphodiesterase domain-containing protein [Gammaproteobacteria bacterium]